jgi:hypothetical protein
LSMSKVPSRSLSRVGKPLRSDLRLGRNASDLPLMNVYSG